MPQSAADLPRGAWLHDCALVSCALVTGCFPSRSRRSPIRKMALSPTHSLLKRCEQRAAA
eukprot:14442746-Heterocapsa_arctica.AAC.1